MKALKLALLISILAISSSALATGGRKMPPVQPTFTEKVIDIFTFKTQ